MSQQKRQIFREQVLPHTGGKIPEDAFRTDRLALNRLNKEGIAIPDGVLFETRHRESHHSSHRHDPDIDSSIIRLVQRPDGRYAPPEGRYPFNNLVESTYVIRPPINIHGYGGVAPIKPHQTTLQLPGRPFFQDGEDIFNSLNTLDNLDLLDTLSPDFPGTQLWTGFGPLFHETTNRILRHSGKKDLIANLELAKQFERKKGSTTFTRTTLNNNLETVRKAPISGVKQTGGVSRIPDMGQGYHHNRRPVGQIKPVQSSASGTYPGLSKIPKTNFVCRRPGRTMEPDPETSCQVFHLCQTDGRKESYLCPQGSRYDTNSNQCAPWTSVICL